MRRLVPLALLAAAASVPAGLALAQTGAPAEPDPGQELFKEKLPADPGTSSAIRRGLGSGALFVDPATQYADLTGDGKADAVVKVDSGGAAGAVALYVFSTDGDPDGDLRVVFRSQTLFRAVAATSGGVLTVQVPRYRRGEDPCCPTRLDRRVYAWSDAKKAFLRRS